MQIDTANPIESNKYRVRYAGTLTQNDLQLSISAVLKKMAELKLGTELDKGSAILPEIRFTYQDDFDAYDLTVHWQKSNVGRQVHGILNGVTCNQVSNDHYSDRAQLLNIVVDLANGAGAGPEKGETASEWLKKGYKSQGFGERSTAKEVPAIMDDEQASSPGM